MRHPRTQRQRLQSSSTLLRSPALTRMPRRILLKGDRYTTERGSVTAEYVIATLAAVSFAGLLVVILRGDEVRQILTEMVRSALSFGG